MAGLLFHRVFQYRAIIAAGALSVLGGCTTFDPLDNRAETANREATDYSYDAALLNVVRAKLDEPLAFVTITGLDGTNSVQGSIGFPSFVFGPHAATSPRTFTFGPNSFGRSASNNMHVSVVDDPASFAALLAPVNPAVMAFFRAQGFDNSLLFFLFTDRLRVIDAAGNVREFHNDPENPEDFRAFGNVLSTLLANGLTSQIDVTSIPTGRGLPYSKICFDPLSKPSFAGGFPSDHTKYCDNTDWISVQPTPPSGSGGGGASSGVTAVAGSDGSLWILRGNQAVRVAKDGSTLTKKLDPAPKDSTKPKSEPQDGFTFAGPHILNKKEGVDLGPHYELYTRSVYGAYNYIGALLRANDGKGTDIDNLQAAGGVITITSDTHDCFAEVDYRDVHYCVPATARNTKRIFTLLHQLQQLDTAPSNAPTTLTVHDVP